MSEEVKGNFVASERWVFKEFSSMENVMQCQRKETSGTLAKKTLKIDQKFREKDSCPQSQ